MSRVLVIQLGRLGDVIQTRPLLEALQQNSRAQVGILVFDSAAVAVQDMPSVRVRTVREGSLPGGLRGLEERIESDRALRTPPSPELLGVLEELSLPAYDRLLNCSYSPLVAPEEFRTALEKASHEQIPLEEAEQATLGFTHSDSWRILAEAWKIPSDIADVIELHDQIGDPKRGGPLVALVHLSDLLCRMRDLGYGYYEPRQIDFANDAGWLYLAMKFPGTAEIDLARFTFALDEYAKEVSDLVATVFGS